MCEDGQAAQRLALAAEALSKATNDLAEAGYVQLAGEASLLRRKASTACSELRGRMHRERIIAQNEAVS